VLPAWRDGRAVARRPAANCRSRSGGRRPAGPTVSNGSAASSGFSTFRLSVPPVARTVTATAAVSQCAAATQAAVGSTSVSSASPPAGISSSSRSAAATCVGEASSRVSCTACPALPLRSPCSARSILANSSATSSTTARRTPALLISASVRPTSWARSMTQLRSTRNRPPRGRFGTRSAASAATSGTGPAPSASV
jgi:hypothetical protein